jgi:hypothetical protein
VVWVPRPALLKVESHLVQFMSVLSQAHSELFILREILTHEILLPERDRESERVYESREERQRIRETNLEATRL